MHAPLIPTVWLFMSLATSVLWAIVNLIDKYILSKLRFSPWDYLFVEGAVGLIIVITIISSGNTINTQYNIVFFSSLSGIFLLVFNIFYFFSLKAKNVVVVIILVQATSVVTLILDLSLNKAQYSFSSYFGMIMILIGVLIAMLVNDSSESTTEGGPPYRTFLPTLFAILAAISLSISYYYQDFILSDTSVISLYFWQRLTVSVFAVPLGLARFKRFKGLHFDKTFTVAIVPSVISLLGFLTLAFAYASGPLATTTFVASLQIIWVAGGQLVLHKWFPKTFGSLGNEGWKNIVFSVFCVIIGLVFLER